MSDQRHPLLKTKKIEFHTFLKSVLGTSLSGGGVQLTNPLMFPIESLKLDEVF